jgi:predicted negative regulator of RcsB-dependent stress response
LEGNFVDDLISEKEQIEQIRTWWSQYGGYVIGGLGLGIALLGGYNYYQNSRIEAQTGASVAYETLTEHVVSGDLGAAEAVADSIVTEYAGTAYAAQAQLAMARLFMDKNRDQDAADVLRELLDSDADMPIKHVARTRLASILLYEGNAQAVVDLLEGQESEAFAASWNELLGDAYRELGRVDDAQAAYQEALLDPMAQATVDQQLVQWKVLDLPEAQSGASEPAPADAPAEASAEDPAVTDDATDDGSEDGE